MKTFIWALLVVLTMGACLGAYRDRYNPVTALEIAWALRDNEDLSTATHLYNLYTDYAAISGYSPAFDSPSFWDYQKAFAATDIPVGVVGRVYNSGSTQGTSGHLVGALGWAEDTAGGKINLIGTEGKALMKGTAASGNGVLGQGLFQGSTFAGAVAGVNGTVSITTNGTVPLAEGTAIAFYAPATVGGANKYGLYISDPARIFQNGSTTKYVQIAHDGSNAVITSSSGGLSFVVPNGSGITGLEGNNAFVLNDTMNNTQIQAYINAAEALGGWTTADPCIIKFTPGSYTGLNLTLDTAYVILDAGDPGVVLAGAIASSGSPAGVYVYVWDHPSGTYPASLTLTGVAEL